MIELGLIGWPLGHSRSPEYFKKKFLELGIEGTYSLFPLENILQLPELIAAHPDLRGLNVTIPYKQSIMAYLKSISQDAIAIGAVNTIVIEQDNGEIRLTGHNTDFIGFMDSLAPIVNKMSFRDDCKALILGTGGASKAIAYGLSKLDIPFVLVSRDPKEYVINGSHQKVISYDDITSELLNRHRIIINCTPLGMWPDTEGCPTLPWDSLPDNAICYDLVYNPPMTEFMKRSAEQGATVKNGLEMLHLQADAAWDLWSR